MERHSGEKGGGGQEERTGVEREGQTQWRKGGMLDPAIRKCFPKFYLKPPDKFSIYVPNQRASNIT